MGISLILVSSGIGRAQLLLIIAMLAGATELLQFFVEGRSPSVFDWVIDMAGAVLGLFLVYLLSRVSPKKHITLTVL